MLDVRTHAGGRGRRPLRAPARGGRGDQKADALIRASLARLEAMRGNFEEARQLYRRSRATLEEFGWNLFAALTSIDSGTVELMARDPAAAENELRRDFEALDAMGERNYIATTSAYLAFALLLQGKYDEADRYVTFSEETAAPDDLTSQFLWRQFRTAALDRRQARRCHRPGAARRRTHRRDRRDGVTGELPAGPGPRLLARRYDGGSGGCVP